MAGPLKISQLLSLEANEPLFYDDSQIRQILKRIKTIAMVGASSNWSRPSYFAMKYLQGKGYRVIPVNPGHAGKEILGERVYACLGDIPYPTDMVDIFRASNQVNGIVDEVLKLYEKKTISVVWMQLGIRNNDAAKKLIDVGIEVVMDRCPKIEYGRIFGELSWSGINSGIISAKRYPPGNK